jgi:hypothetical protein
MHLGQLLNLVRFTVIGASYLNILMARILHPIALLKE